METSRKSCCNAAPLGDLTPPGHPNTRRNNSTACGLHRNIDQTPEVSLRGIRIAVGPELNARVSVRCGHLPSRCRQAPHRAMVGMRDFRMSRELDIAWVSHTPDAVSRLLDCPVSRKGVVFPLNPEPNRLRVIWDIGLHPDLMPLELRGIRAISGLHSSDRVQRIPWGSACPGRYVDALHCNRSATKSRFPRRLRAIRRRARSGTPRAAAR